VLAGAPLLAAPAAANAKEWVFAPHSGRTALVYRFDIDTGLCNTDARSLFRLQSPRLATITACTAPGRPPVTQWPSDDLRSSRCRASRIRTLLKVPAGGERWCSVAVVCLRSCRRNSGNSAARRIALNERLTFRSSAAVPMLDVNTSPDSVHSEPARKGPDSRGRGYLRFERAARPLEAPRGAILLDTRQGYRS
jgi:hypothetical protein